jgi:hypothetical protein
VLAVPRASAEEQARWRGSEDEWLGAQPEGAAGPPARAKDPTETPEGVVALAGGGRRPSEKRAAPARTLDATATDLREDEVDDEVDDDDANATASSVRPATADAGPPSGAAREPAAHKGEVGTAQRLLVECALCGFLVRIPPAFFGKTIHCPECAGDTVFSESTLEPVKDELVDRMALETTERDLLFRLEGEGRARRWTTFRSFLLGVGLGLLAILAIAGVVLARRGAARDAVVQQALREGWRWATNEDDPRTLHEPWCRELTRIGERVSEEERAKRPELVMHDCY